jgi:hypothetical protein
MLVFCSFSKIYLNWSERDVDVCPRPYSFYSQSIFDAEYRAVSGHLPKNPTVVNQSRRLRRIMVGWLTASRNGGFFVAVVFC